MIVGIHVSDCNVDFFSFLLTIFVNYLFNHILCENVPKETKRPTIFKVLFSLNTESMARADARRVIKLTKIQNKYARENLKGRWFVTNLFIKPRALPTEQLNELHIWNKPALFQNTGQQVHGTQFPRKKAFRWKQTWDSECGSMLFWEIHLNGLEKSFVNFCYSIVMIYHQWEIINCRVGRIMFPKHTIGKDCLIISTPEFISRRNEAGFEADEMWTETSRKHQSFVTFCCLNNSF